MPTERRRPDRDPKPSDEDERIAELLLTAARAVARGRRERPTAKTTARPAPIRVEDFVDRARAKINKDKTAKEATVDKAAKARATLAERRDHLDALIPLAEIVAGRAKVKGVDPDFKVIQTRVKHKEKKLPQINRVDKQKKVVEQKEQVHAEGGWLLARKGIVSKGKMLVEEAILGDDGKIHIVIRGDLYGATELLNKEAFSRKEIIKAPTQRHIPSTGIIDLAHNSTKGMLVHQTVVTGNEYPFFGFGPYGDGSPRSLTPEVIQAGLEDFTSEHELLS